MKHNNRLTVFILAAISILLVSCGTTQSVTEKAEKEQLVEKQIENLDFKFTATFAYPQSYPSISLSPYYDVMVSPDTVKAYLPYFGRAYRAPISQTDGGIKFESTDFESEVKKGKKNGLWHIIIRTHDTSHAYTLTFNIWNNGNARLNVNDQDRQTISFDGVVEERKEVKALDKQKKPK